MERLQGVERAVVSLKQKKAFVRYDAERVSPEQMVEAVEEVGFGASLPEGAE